MSVWSVEAVTEFIRLFRENSCLWMVKSKDYTNRSKRNEAYDALVKFCRTIGFPSANREFVTKKIQNLRGAFRKELKKVIEARKSGSQEVYQPSLWYYDLLLFIEDQEAPTPSVCDITEDDSVDAETEIQESPYRTPSRHTNVTPPPTRHVTPNTDHITVEVSGKSHRKLTETQESPYRTPSRHTNDTPPQQSARHVTPNSDHNCRGTPIQIQRTGKVAGSKSFGDSIKRHIFNKGLLNKTPKKGSGSSINTVAEKSSKKRYTDDSKVDVSHKNIVLKNLANKMISTESLDDECDSDASNESTLSEGAISKSKKISPKFVSEPNLSIIDNEETPKKPKRGPRMFRSKVPSGIQILNKKYQKRATVVRSTPTSCVSCINDQDTVSDDDISIEKSIENTPRKSKFYAIDTEFKMNYQTSTPGISETVFSEDCSTPYTMNFRRASMSPITKSTQKLSKAMQESIMTPRSRKPLIITSEQRDNTMEVSEPQEESHKVDKFQSKSDIYQSKSEIYQSKSEIYQSKSDIYQSKSEIYRSISPKNDSDFVSSDDDMNSRSSFSFERSRHASMPRINIEGCTELCSKRSSSNSSDKNFNTTLLAEDIENTQKKSLTEPFREYLLSRSVLTATPIDLSILNHSSETEKISESLLYCLNGNVPTDLTSSISNLAVESIADIRSPLKDVNVDISPNRKRSAPSVEVTSKVMKEGEEENFKPRETDL